MNLWYRLGKKRCNRMFVIVSLPLLIAALLTTTSLAFANEPSAMFRHAFACPDRGNMSVCMFGKIPAGAAVTVIAKDWKSAAEPREQFPNSDFDNGIDTITRLQAAEAPPRDSDMMVVLASAESVALVPQIEVHDRKVVQRIEQHLLWMKDADKIPDQKYRIDVRLIKLSPKILLAETKVSSHIEGTHPTTGKKLILCEHCDDDIITMPVATELRDIFAELRRPDRRFCGGLVSAFVLDGRVHIFNSITSCESDAYAYLPVHDLSGPTPRLIFE